MAVASMVLGILSFACLGPLCAIPGIITGHIALARIGRDRNATGGRGMAIAGLVLGYANIVIFIVVFILFLPIFAAIMLPSMARAREAARRASCANNMKQMGLVCKMFASENDGRFPELSPEAGRLMFANEGIGQKHPVVPEYLADLSVLVCPSDTDISVLKDDTALSDPNLLMDDHSYFYLGYLVTNDAEVEAFAGAYKNHVSRGYTFDRDLGVAQGTGTAGGDKIYRLWEGVELSLVADALDPLASVRLQSAVPVLIERPEHHLPGGGNVLYMDGHVEFLRYPSEWPMTEKTIGILESLGGL